MSDCEGCKYYNTENGVGDFIISYCNNEKSKLYRENIVYAQKCNLYENDTLFLPILDLSEVGITEQYEKVQEEFTEFMCSCFNSKEELEEGIDNILAMWNYLNKQYSKDDIKKAFEYNMQKAQNRYKVIGKLIISEVE